MSNPLYKSVGNTQFPGPLGNIQNLMNRYQQFRQSFHGNPQQQVQQLLNSGQMSQEQFNMLKQFADQYKDYFK